MPQDNNPSFYKNATSDEKVEVFFRKYYVVLCQGVNRILKDEALTEDVVQEVFIKVWEKREKLDFNEQFIYYLKKSCYHTALNVLSGKMDQQVTDGALNVSENIEADSPIQFSELENQVHSAINELPEKTKLVFTLSRYEGMSYKEIATQMQVSVKSVEKHMGIALKRLRVSLKDHLVYLILIILYH